MKKEDMVMLISAEGFEFVIDKKAAMVSQTIRSMLTGGFFETEHRKANFPEISTIILEKICQYFHWYLRYASPLLRLSSGCDVKSRYSLCLADTSCPFVYSGKKTEFHIEPELTLELMMAANYLDT
ncbi:hypothetical protein SASPL_119755 [Salvia splendens]|uniref:Elongin-C n=1 Tax=Salvia splendens TaxID=180675 RepID=A0A8X8XU46_SALSN|nr:hypothetical protein SASPL_119755 [Salvia splendens]